MPHGVAIKDKPVKFTFWRIHEPRRNVGINSLQIVAHAEGLPLMERTEAMLRPPWGPREPLPVHNLWREGHPIGGFASPKRRQI
jgi:hypothetical protein